MSKHYDLVILGAGPAGYVAAIRASQLGMKVALVERRTSLGGTCMNVGCIPSKALLHSSEFYTHIKERSNSLGIEVQDLQLKVKNMQKHKQSIVKKLGDGIQFLMKKHGITVYKGTGTVTDAHRVALRNDEGSEELNGEKILLATGSTPQEIPHITCDGHSIVTSTEALEFQEVPTQLLVVGGGVIGLEIGSIWARLGSKVLILEGTKEILPGWDIQLAKLARRELESQGIRFLLNAKVASIKKSGKKLQVGLTDSKESVPEGDKVLIAVGRRPVLDCLDMTSMNIEQEPRTGHLKVNEDYQTSVASIYAIGDIIKGPMLAHKASEEAVTVIERMHGIAAQVNYSTIPNVVYTQPEIASVGFSEEVLKEKGISYKKGEAKFSSNGRALATGFTKGNVKILSDALTDDILGIHILGPHASELIGKAVIAMEFSASSEDIARIVSAHPTLTETLKEAALGISGHKIHSI